MTPRYRQGSLLALAIAAPLALHSARIHADELPIPVETATLPNGLRVVMSVDHTTPTVAIAVYYDVGGRVEERGRTGFAHLFEHMMFEGSANVARGEHFRLIGAHGGDFNGTTSEDRTNYYETLPSNAMNLGLWLEADRMRSLNVTSGSFENQRQTVMEERRQSYENRPYALSLLRRDELAYGSYFPYAHSVIGDVTDLEHAPLEAVRAFHDRYYAPNNAVISLAGDFDPAQAMALIRQDFGAIPRHETPAFQDPGFPAQTAERRDTVTDAHAELPAFHIVWHIPPRRTPDHYALEILASILGDGESSRLYQDLVKTREVASTVEVATEDRRGPDLFTIWCINSAGHDPAHVEPMVLHAIDDIAQHGITGRELEKARNRVRATFVFGLQSNLQRAEQLGEFQVYDGNAALLRTELDRYLAVQLDDIRRVAAQYLTAQNRTVLDVLPTHPAEAAPPGADDHAATPGHPPAGTAASPASNATRPAGSTPAGRPVAPTHGGTQPSAGSTHPTAATAPAGGAR